MTFVLMALVPLLAAPSGPDAAAGPSAPVGKLKAAHNPPHPDGFMAVFAPDGELIEFPDKVLAKGTDAVRKRYQARLAEPNLHVDIVSRMVIGDKVIDRERIVRTFPEGPGTWDVVAISEVKDGKVSRLWVMA